MGKKTIFEAQVSGVEKRQHPSKHYVFVVEVSWSEGTGTKVYRRYCDFFEFQCQLLEKFPIEGGAKDPSSRIIPFLPGKRLIGRSNTRAVAEKRKEKIDEYCRTLVRLPSHISDDDSVTEFFEAWPEDINPNLQEKRSKSPEAAKGGEEISGPMLLDRYTAIADYEKQKKNECSLKAGQVVEVIDKNPNGWWFVNLDNYMEGWVPATYLESIYGVEEAQPQVLSPGEEEIYITTSFYRPKSKDELNFEKGVVVQVCEKRVDGWWKVRYQGREALAPAAYLCHFYGELTEGAAPTQLVTSAKDAVNTVTSPTGTASRSVPTWHSQSPASRSKFQDKEPIYAPTPRRHSIKRQHNIRPPLATVTRFNPGSSFDEADLPQNVYEEIPEIMAAEKYTTIGDFTASQTSDGLSFSAGETVSVITKNPTGWWYVELRGQEGWVPSSYLEQLSPTHTRSSKSTSSSPKMEQRHKLTSRSAGSLLSSPTSPTSPTSPPSSMKNSPNCEIHSSSNWKPVACPNVKTKPQPTLKPSKTSDSIDTMAKPKPATPSRPRVVGSDAPAKQTLSKTKSDATQRSPRPARMGKSPSELSIKPRPPPPFSTHGAGEKSTLGSEARGSSQQKPQLDFQSVLQKQLTSLQRTDPSSAPSRGAAATPPTSKWSNASREATTASSSKAVSLKSPAVSSSSRSSGVARPLPNQQSKTKVPPKRPPPPSAGSSSSSSSSSSKRPGPPRPGVSPAVQKKLSTGYVSLSSYDGVADGCIGFREGVKVEVLEKNNDGWWFVKIGAMEGWAPSSYLEEVGGSNPRPARPPAPKLAPSKTQEVRREPPLPKPRKKSATLTPANSYRAVASYEVSPSAEPGMTYLEEGVVYQVLEKGDDGWWFVHGPGEQEGWAPSTYLEPA